jgi:hypothetical protein
VYLPAAQSVQDDDLAHEYLPGAHGMHDGDPKEEYVPASHTDDVVELNAGAYSPGVVLTQVVASVVAW